MQDALAQPYNTKVQTLQSRISSDYLQATALRQKLVALDPRNAPYQFALAQDAAAGRQYTTAATALKAYLDLEPNLDAATRQQLEQTLKALQSFGTTPATPCNLPLARGVWLPVFPAFSPYGTMRACRSRY